MTGARPVLVSFGRVIVIRSKEKNGVGIHHISQRLNLQHTGLTIFDLKFKSRGSDEVRLKLKLGGVYMA
jgi:hypothetical protein